jgi:hypothetical protein
MDDDLGIVYERDDGVAIVLQTLPDARRVAVRPGALP